jgi:hypothetical protein
MRTFEAPMTDDAKILIADHLERLQSRQDRIERGLELADG